MGNIWILIGVVKKWKTYIGNTAGSFFCWVFLLGCNLTYKVVRVHADFSSSQTNCISDNSFPNLKWNTLIVYSLSSGHSWQLTIKVAYPQKVFFHFIVAHARWFYSRGPFISGVIFTSHNFGQPPIILILIGDIHNHQLSIIKNQWLAFVANSVRHSDTINISQKRQKHLIQLNL